MTKFLRNLLSRFNENLIGHTHTKKIEPTQQGARSGGAV